MGFATWLVVNGVFGGLLLAISAFSTAAGEGARPRIDVTIPVVALALLNVAAAAGAWYTRRYVAFGIVVGLVTSIAVGVVGGAFLWVAGLFAISALGGGAGGFAFLLVPLIGLIVVIVGLVLGARTVNRRIR